MANWLNLKLNQWTDVYAALDISVGLSLMLQNIGQARLAFAISETVPMDGHLDLVAKIDDIIEVKSGAAGLWVKQYMGNPGDGLLVGRTKTDFSNLRPYTGLDQVTVSGGGGGGTVTSHGDLTDLEADDHPQYYNQVRGDTRYLRKGNTIPSDITGLSDLLTTLTNAVDERVIKVVGKGLSANDFTDLLLAKLNSLPSGSAGKVNWSDIVGFTMPAHNHNIADVSGLQTALDNKVGVQAGKGLSSNDYTTAEKSKLASIEGSHYRGVYASLSALQSAVTTPVAGDYADVDTGAGSAVSRFIWDASDSNWVQQVASGGAMTGAQIKTALFAEADTNNFSNSYKSKVDGIATGATANATDAQLRDRATHTGAQAISTVTGLQAALDGKAGTAVASTSTDGLMSAADKTKLSGISAGATVNATDAQLRDRSTHTGVQAISTITDLQTALDGKQKTITQSATQPASPQVGDLWIQF
ncbi:MAG: hypothetical protein U5L02_06460 [Rheinheimera sp.]|nr:hypothetical protein [Rheinheimera sp.]